MGRACITMHKLKENEEFVWYRFEMQIIEKAPSKDLKEKSINQNTTRIPYGYCKFNKKTGDFSLDEEKTDNYYLIKKNWTGAVNYVLIKHFKENKGYPNITGYSA